MPKMIKSRSFRAEIGGGAEATSPPGRGTAGLELEPTLGGGNRAVLFDANLDAHRLPPRPCLSVPASRRSRVSKGQAGSGGRPRQERDQQSSASKHFVDLRFEVRWLWSS